MLLEFVWIFNNDVRANCFCASLLRTQVKYRKPSHVVSALAGNKINNDKADRCLDLTILDVWWPLFFFWWIIFSTGSLRLAKNCSREIDRLEAGRSHPWLRLLLEVWFFCNMHHRIPFFLALRLSVRRYDGFQMPLEGLSSVKTLLTSVRFIYAADPLLQNMTKIGYLRWLTVDILTINPCRSCWLRALIFQHASSLSSHPQFFAFLTQVTHYLTAVKILKKSIE